MNTLTPHQDKALNIEKSISLTANAGSGKTFVLTQRFLHIVLNTSTPLSKVAAITFTEKAAGELFQRISIELDNLLLSSEYLEQKARIEKLRKQLVSAKISTIHSFCIDLLKEFPVEASLDANFSTINKQKSSELIDLSIQSTLREMLKSPEGQPDVKILIRLLGSFTRLASELSGLISKRKNIQMLIKKFYASDEIETSIKLYKIFERNLKVLFGDVIPDVLTHLKNINDEVLAISSKNKIAIELKVKLDRIKNLDAIKDIVIKLKDISQSLLTGIGQVRKQGYLPAKNRDGFENSIRTVEDIFSQLNEIEITDNHELIEHELSKHIFLLLNVFENVLSTYENKKLELGVLDFEDILLKTRTLLNSKSVRESLFNKFEYLLVDEYQDTNEIQYDIFLPLLDDLKRGNLFIVGDEKQSIYRFRDAELKVFSTTKNDIKSFYGDDSLLTLPDSFRMAPAICLFVNYLFKNLFKENREIFNEVLSSDLVCARTDEFRGKVEILIANDEEYSEAELVSKKIISLKSEGKDYLNNWNDFAILVRKRASFVELQKTFIKYGIPFNVIGGRGFYQKQTISDIYNYFSFLLNDKDDAALIGILRSPFILVSDIKIFELSSFEGEYYWDKIKSAAKSKIKPWQNIYETLNENKKLSGRINIPFLLRKILRESDFISVISSRVDASQEISNLNKLITITNDFFNDEFSTVYDYVIFIKNSIDGTEDESQAKIESGSIGVNILTIHQAKGLEFPAVFLYNCNDTSQINKVKSKSFTVDKDFGILTKVPLNENYFGSYHSAPIVGIYNLIEEQKEIAELKRLLYVGLTRAKDFLFLTKTDDGKSLKKNSFATLLNEGLNQELNYTNIKISGELEYLSKENNNYLNISKPIEIEIPIIRKIDSINNEVENEITEISNKEMLLAEIADYSKGEVISATRYSTFSSCPMKYNLLYNYKIGDLIQRSKRFNQRNKMNFEEEYNRNELETYLLDDHSSAEDYSKLKGDIIHYALRKSVKSENLSAFIEKRLKSNYADEIHQSLIEDISNDLTKFYDSDEFIFINTFHNNRNEFEAYLKEEDFYLFGILDKLIIDENKLMIVDYKTDNIDEDQIKKRAERYLPQLKFYAYIVSRLFSKSLPIEGRLVFIKHPNKSFIFNYDEKSDKQINSNLAIMIYAIRNNNYSLNLNACDDCIFSADKTQCINNDYGIN